MRHVLFALCLLLSACGGQHYTSPALGDKIGLDLSTVIDVAQTWTPPPSPARAKFPQEDPRLIDSLDEINHVVNENMTYVDDKVHYGVEEKWVGSPVDWKGDCEDYALTKMEFLRQAGYPTLEWVRIRSVVVHTHTKEGDAGHAILEVRLPGGDIVFMDLNYDTLMTRAELMSEGYQFFDW